MTIYSCHNRPRPTANAPVTVQDGWIDTPGSRIPRMVTVPFVMTTECQYDATMTDKSCAGCWQVKRINQEAAP